MKQILPVVSAVMIVYWLSLFPVEAEIVDVQGGWSNVRVFPSIIDAPPAVLDNDVMNQGMQGFNEAQDVITSVDHAHDGGFIPAGSLVDSHMIFLNSEHNYRWFRDVKWVFDGVIIGVMSDNWGRLEHASTFELGNPSTIYPAAPFQYRGLERNDGYSFTSNPNELIVTMQDQGFGDWIRVVTAPTPVDDLEVEIQIKPGGNPNSINCKYLKGVVPVAILTTADFDALTVNHASVLFEGARETHMDKKTGSPRRHETDVDGDGDTDLLFHFRLGETGLTCESVEGILTGELWDGIRFTGRAEVSMVPATKVIKIR
jgi:hypothetical protein